MRHLPLHHPIELFLFVVLVLQYALLSIPFGEVHPLLLHVRMEFDFRLDGGYGVCGEGTFGRRERGPDSVGEFVVVGLDEGPIGEAIAFETGAAGFGLVGAVVVARVDEDKGLLFVFHCLFGVFLSVNAIGSGIICPAEIGRKSLLVLSLVTSPGASAASPSPSLLLLFPPFYHRVEMHCDSSKRNNHRDCKNVRSMVPKG